ncbi:hypothetical protein QR680_004826 [Steinernema hermaphroditum]|uniref:Ground-like domain-containing protein n=1 Tax=Steinernema hermaphroditum TaxID=289476 RepID=A0AA39LTU6_9BILA|nr:hypothetical protein QR680_004826 [Steinernema hermaphroditum]
MLPSALLCLSLPTAFGFFFGGLGGSGCSCPSASCAPAPVCPEPVPCSQVVPQIVACPAPSPPQYTYIQPSYNYVAPPASPVVVPVAPPAAVSSYGGYIPTQEVRPQTVTTEITYAHPQTVTTEGTYAHPYGPAAIEAASFHAPLVDNTVVAPTPDITDAPRTVELDIYDQQNDRNESEDPTPPEKEPKPQLLEVAPVSRDPTRLIPADMMAKRFRILTSVKEKLSRPNSSFENIEEALDPAVCNNRQLQRIMTKAMNGELASSKKMIKKATKLAFGVAFDVLCADEDFSYSVYSRHYCETTRDNVTCFAFL